MSLSEKRLFLLDMDGTLYLDDRLFDKVPEFLSYIRRTGGRYLFLTNNSSRGVEGYIDKLSGMGIPSGTEDYLTSVDAYASLSPLNLLFYLLMWLLPVWFLSGWVHRY